MCLRWPNGSRIANTRCRSQFRSLTVKPMHPQLTTIPTNSLIEMIFLILSSEPAVTPTDGREIQQIQCELQRRGEDRSWSFCTVN